jgi:uncharacterized protein YebE (UPF0316 family)
LTLRENHPVAVLSSYPLLPLLIFLAEMSVVTLGTMRVIFISRGMKYLAPLLGSFEITIWLFAIGQIMKNLNDVNCYAAFAAGFTLGNFLGIFIEKRLAIGNVLVRIVTPRDAADLVASLKAAHFGLTCLNAEGATGPVKMIFTLIKRRELGQVEALIKRFDARTFYSVDEIQWAAGVFPPSRTRFRSVIPGLRSLRLFA